MNAGSFRTPRFALLTLPLLFAVGCDSAKMKLGVSGRWELVEAKPNREVFAIDDAHFDGKGRFTATCTREGRTLEQTGEYDYNGLKLWLHPDTGGMYKYSIKVQMNTMTITDGKKQVRLKRVE